MFPAWLRSLGEDAAALGADRRRGDGPEPARKYVVAGLNYLFKSLDLIPDGIDDLGFLDDAFVLRVAAALAVAESLRRARPSVLGAPGRRRARGARSSSATDYARLETYVRGLRKGAARGRTVEDIVDRRGDARRRSPARCARGRRRIRRRRSRGTRRRS